jgi:hypothetical protein
MKRLAALKLALLALLCAPCAAGPAGDDASEVPFSFEQGYVIVQAKIRGDKPVEVILSTGSEHSSVDMGLLDKYKLSRYYAGEGIITGRSTDKVVFFSTVPDVRLGGVQLSSLNMRLGSLAEISSRLGREIFGIFGADFFKGRAAQFDFAGKVLRFLPKAAAGALKDKKGGGGEAGSAVLPMVSDEEGPTLLPVAERVTYNGKQVKTLFDTGTVAVVALSFAATKQLGLAPPDKGAARQDKINSLRFDQYELTDVPAALYPKGSQFERDMKEFGAVAGSVLLQNFVVTFDFGNKLIILKRV